MHFGGTWIYALYYMAWRFITLTVHCSIPAYYFNGFGIQFNLIDSVLCYRFAAGYMAALCIQ
jgi:hypothetical protein